MKLIKTYNTHNFPIQEDLEQFAIFHSPEIFTKEERRFLKPFFSNFDKPVFITRGLPEEVIGALSSRYSRATKSLRRLFLDEYLGPIVSPEIQKDWGELSKSEKRKKLVLKKKFYEYLEFWEKSGGVDKVVNAQRGRAFFDKWLDGYGDDSIAELGGVHLLIEGASNLAVNEMQSQRVGLSPLEKSSRYVSFASRRADGNYQYVVPGEIKNKPIEKDYCEMMDTLFDLYSSLSQPYLEYIKKMYPMDETEPVGAFNRSRGAKRFDDLRELLPFATQTNVAFYGNGRAYEAMINRLLGSQIGEVRWWGQQICRELETEVPSFVRRPQTDRGAQAQLYRRNITATRREIVNKVLGKLEKKSLRGLQRPQWARIVSHTPESDIAVLSTFLTNNQRGITLDQIRKRVKALSSSDREKYLKNILRERKFGEKNFNRETNRFRKPPRAFENAQFTYLLKARGGDYRDLHRHRQLTHERHMITTQFGYDMDDDILNSPFGSDICNTLEKVVALYNRIAKIVSVDVAQYVVPFAYIQTWYATMTARELYWIVELRTGPQGRPHYREICQQIANEAIKVAPVLFSALLVDRKDYKLSRRESEIKSAKKRGES